ncbi:hypothetical protein MHYP_G00000510 [Metynnis hypsauchen]
MTLVLLCGPGLVPELPHRGLWRSMCVRDPGHLLRGCVRVAVVPYGLAGGQSRRTAEPKCGGPAKSFGSLVSALEPRG